MARIEMHRQGSRLYMAWEGDPATWAQMRALGQAIGEAGTWDLVSLNDAVENGFVQSFLQGSSWIGLVQSPLAEGPSEGWSWVDGTDLGHVNWAPNEPNDYYGPHSEEHGLIYADGTWNDEQDPETLALAVFEASAKRALDLTGTGSGDVLRGGNLGDRLSGAAGDDLLIGGGGADTLTGGAGADTLVGGAGADVFVLTTASDSSDLARDLVRGFVQGEDLLDFTALGTGLHWAGSDGFHGVAGEITSREFPGSGRTLVMVDLDGDRVMDAALRLAGSYSLTEADFV